jgi:transcriptional regulator with XRE-family HTH domain
MRVRRERIPHVDDPVAVGRRLREERIASGLSQRELAFAGCSAAYISRIERGERTPSLQVLRELSQRCDTTEGYLAWGREELDDEVSRQIRTLQEARVSGSKAECRAAYAALGRAAHRAARTLGP